MVPRVAQRGHSFKGAGQYYLHDKKAETAERVAWTYTHNLPTDDPEKALKWMAFTAKNADKLKEEAGVKATGRRATAGCVYSYSLAWHPEEKPEQEYMRTRAMETLEFLGLKEHEAVFVAHNETEHDHVHVIVNLIHPETGKTAVVYKDQYILSEWASAYEQSKGQIYCEERIKNNELRQGRGEKNLVAQHKEDQLHRANLFHDLYSRSDNAQAFKAALLEQGYHLAAGERRDYVVIDEQGKVHSLSRHLNLVVDKETNKNWRSEYRDRLKDLELDNSTELAAKLQQTYAQTHIAEQHQDKVDFNKGEVKKVEDIERTTNENIINFKTEIGSNDSQSKGLKEDILLEGNAMLNLYYKEKQLQLLDWDQTNDNRKAQLNDFLTEYYKPADVEKNIVELKLEIENLGAFAKISGKRSRLEEHLQALINEQINIQQRIKEQQDKLSIQIESERSKFIDDMDRSFNIDQYKQEDDSNSKQPSNDLSNESFINKDPSNEITM